MTNEPNPQRPTVISLENLPEVAAEWKARADAANARRERKAAKDARARVQTIVAVPGPWTVELSQLPGLADKILATVDHVEDIDKLDATLELTAAITSDLKGRHREALRPLAKAERAMEVRIGELLGPRQQGKRNDLNSTCPSEDKLPRQRASEFRLMAEYQCEPAVADAIRRGDSRSQVLRLVKKAEADQQPADHTDLEAHVEIDAAAAAHPDPIIEPEVALSPVAEPDTASELAVDPSEDGLDSEPRSEVLPRLDAGTDKDPGPIDSITVARSKARVAKARELAAEGQSSHQIGAALDIKHPYPFMKYHGIEVPADKYVKNTRGIDSTRIVTVGASTLEGLVAGYELADIDEVDPEDLGPLVESMTESLRYINRFHGQLKERVK